MINQMKQIFMLKTLAAILYSQPYSGACEPREVWFVHWNQVKSNQEQEWERVEVEWYMDHPKNLVGQIQGFVEWLSCMVLKSHAQRSIDRGFRFFSLLQWLEGLSVIGSLDWLDSPLVVDELVDFVSVTTAVCTIFGCIRCCSLDQE